MAKHAKKRKKTTSRRRRVGATAALNPSSPLVQYGSIAAGYLFGDKINAAIDKVVPATVDSKLVGAGQVGLGYLLAMKKGGKKNLITTVAGGVAIGAGAKRLMAAFGMGNVGGYQMVPAIGNYGDVPAVGAGTSRRRVGSYMPGAHGLNGYATTRTAIGGTGLSNASSPGSDLLAA